jgi:hypothetical protein
LKTTDAPTSLDHLLHNHPNYHITALEVKHCQNQEETLMNDMAHIKRLMANRNHFSFSLRLTNPVRDQYIVSMPTNACHTTLHIPCGNGDIFELPAKLESLHIFGNPNHHIDTFVLPPNLRSLKLSNYTWQATLFPPSLSELCLGENFDQPLGDLSQSLPNLKVLRVCGSFDRPLESFP